MANYCCVVRTNYFHVKDDEAFRSLMNTVQGSENTISVWEENDNDGKILFGFGTYGGIAGIVTPEDEDSEGDYDAFIDRLQELVADDDAIIIFEAGNENLRYVIGSATVITSTNYQYLNITNLAEKTASQMLGNPSWRTQSAY